MSGRIVFLGTAALCLPFLQTLRDRFELPLIVTQPDKPSGRNRMVCHSCVKTFALEHDIPVLQPQTLSDRSVLQAMHQLDPDIAVVIAYGQWIPPSFYSIPTFRTINVHFSLLPAYRGAAPVQRAIQDGLTRTGVTIFELARKMDAGPIWTQFPMDISPKDTTETLWQRMSLRSAPVLIETLETIFSRATAPIPQDETRMTLAPMISKEEGRINWTFPAQTLENTLRAFTPWPGLFFRQQDRVIKVLAAEAVDFPHSACPGQMHALTPQGLDVICGGHSLLRITQIQPPGKSAMTPYCFSQGNQIGPILE
jgi:methionyl-tRNA formyltransferase